MFLMGGEEISHRCGTWVHARDSGTHPINPSFTWTQGSGPLFRDNGLDVRLGGNKYNCKLDRENCISYGTYNQESM